MSHRPLFIVVEGLDGSGKTTQVELLKHHLLARNEPCIVTQEPTDRPIGKLIRQVLRGEVATHPKALAALYAADRLDHLYEPEHGILDRLAGGYHVIASRYYFSSLAYQSEFADPAWIAGLNREAKQVLPADLTIFLDLDPDVSLERIRARGEELELFDTREKLTHVRESFHQAFKFMGQGERIEIVDASADVPTIAERIGDLVDGLLNEPPTIELV